MPQTLRLSWNESLWPSIFLTTMSPFTSSKNWWGKNDHLCTLVIDQKCNSFRTMWSWQTTRFWVNVQAQRLNATFLTYHLTAECTEHCSVYYLNQSLRGYPAVCNVHVFSSDTVADLKAAIEESSGIPQQNQALYDCDSGHNPKRLCITIISLNFTITRLWETLSAIGMFTSTWGCLLS